MAYRRLAAMAAAALTLSACQKPDIWNSPTADQAQFHRDNLECQMIARSVVGDQFVMGTPMFVAMAGAAHQENVKGAYRECMMGKNYTRQQKRIAVVREHSGDPDATPHSRSGTAFLTTGIIGAYRPCVSGPPSPCSPPLSAASRPPPAPTAVARLAATAVVTTAPAQRVATERQRGAGLTAGAPLRR